MYTCRKYESLNIIRAVACLMVIAVHVSTNTGYSSRGLWFSFIIPIFYNVVPLFMVISAFGMCCGYLERFKNKEIDISEFYLKRYKRIWPFFAYLCFIDFIISPSINSIYEIFVNCTLCFGLIPNAKITVIGVGWFIGIVFAFYMLFPFFTFLLSDKKRAWLSLFTSIGLSIISSAYFKVDDHSIIVNFCYFIVGGIIYIYKDKLEKYQYRYIVYPTIFIIVLITYIMFDRGIIIISTLSASIVICGLIVPDKIVDKAKMLKYIGGISFEIYLCHMVIYRAIEKLKLLRITGNDYLDYLIVYCIVLLGAIYFVIISKKILKFFMSYIVKRRKVYG